MITSEEIRTFMVERLNSDLIGPINPKDTEEVLLDYPSDKYLTGILFPRQSIIPQEEDDELPNGSENDDEESNEEVAPLSQCTRPASAGLSFMLSKINGTDKVEFIAEIKAARYQKRWISGDGKTLTDEPQAGKEKIRWQRIAPVEAIMNIEREDTGESSIDLQRYGFEGLELYLQIVNISTNVAVTAILINRKVSKDDRDTNEENSWFQTQLTIKPSINCVFERTSTQSGNFSRDDQTSSLIYRDVLEFAQGHTCSAIWKTELNGDVSSIQTSWIPSTFVEATSREGDKVFDSIREHSSLKPFSSNWLSSCSPAELIESLKMLPESYERWIKTETLRISSLPAGLRPFAEYHQLLWEKGSHRIYKAISRLEKDPNVSKSFQLANKAMALQRLWVRNDKDLVWYPFQLAFLLLVLESVLDRTQEDRDVMDLLWFPTGGGKTEAYLAVIAMLLFYRRLSEKNDDEGAGVSVIMRYTLRVLTTQQFERAANLICACEYLRKLELSETNTKAFSIGLWIGSSSIPNLVAEARNDNSNRAIQIQECPCCHSRILLGQDKSKFEIFCRNPDCNFGRSNEPLPIWTVDEDIYRVLPSLLIGTVDKFAQISRKEEVGKLFGRGTPHLPPDLIIQDELHLISGPLGTLTALYETAIDEFCKVNEHPIKIIGSTATIKMAEIQVKELFNRRLYQFPPPGIDFNNSCFAVKDVSRPSRLYLGITTAGRSAKFTLQAVSASLMQSAYSPIVPEVHRDDYWTLVTYFNSLRELGGAHVLMLDDVPKSISEFANRRKELPRDIREPSELTSRLSQSEIPEVLRKLQEKQQSSRAEDVLLCTNMISVGLDIPRLALMIVNGQPKSVAEYIQATSRVGRDITPGLVLTIFNNNKPRDRSRFETFKNWHTTLYRDVESTSVTPFAPRALDKALRAVIVAMVRHIIPIMKTNPVLNADKRLEVEQLVEVFIKRAKKIDPTEKDEVRNRISIILDEWEKREGLKYYWNEYKPLETLMMSAELIAARRAAHKPESNIWSAPNSMRDVEPETHFLLIN